MSSEAEHQPVVEHVENALEDDNARNENEQVAAQRKESQGEAQRGSIEEQNANTTENDAEGNGDVEEENLNDPYVFKMAARELDKCYMSVISSLNMFSHEDEDVFANAVEICNDIITMEQSLFSDVPSYVADYIATYRAKTDKFNNSVQPRLTVPTAEGAPRYWEERRAYVDPGVPLKLPYDAERFKKEHPERAQSEGTYHDLFYGDGSKLVFEPQANSKRKQIEEEQRKAFHPLKQAPQSYEPPRKKPMRVSADFVPSCAEVNYPKDTKHTNLVNKVTPKKGQRKSVSKQ